MVDEQLETFDEDGLRRGLVERSIVHASGLWHCATHVWLFDHGERVLMQRRASSKDVAPDCWDLSLGEHLQPGETYAQAAHRGLAEELGIAAIELTALGGVRRMRLDRAAAGIHDYELQQSFWARQDGVPEPDTAEVAELRWFTPADLRRGLRERPEDFTPWCRQDIAELALL